MENATSDKVLKEKRGEAKTEEPGKKLSLPRYLSEVRQEFARISWPTRNQVLRESLVVVAMVTLITLFVFLLDTLFNLLFNWLIK